MGCRVFKGKKKRDLLLKRELKRSKHGNRGGLEKREGTSLEVPILGRRGGGEGGEHRMSVQRGDSGGDGSEIGVGPQYLRKVFEMRGARVVGGAVETK